MNTLSLINVPLAVALGPLLLGVINRTKACFAGRSGPPLLQVYYDLWKFSGKGATYSRTTSWVFRAGPIVGLACALLAAAIVPLGPLPGTIGFAGDLLLMAYLLGLMRFFTVLAALDTGSAFEGMGASREVTFSALAEPALLVGLATLVRQVYQHGGGSLWECLSLTTVYQSAHLGFVAQAGPSLLLVAAAFLVVFLAENARIPVDDPNTHLELTMIHEVMVLDHSGPDLAMILYGSAVKLWVLGALLAGVLLPVHTGNPGADLAIFVGVMLLLAVATGVIESTMARFRMARVPQLLVAAAALSAISMLLAWL